MDNAELRKVQLIQLSIATEIKRICDKNDIDYFWDMLKREKDRFKTIPTEMFTEDGKRIQCKFNIETPDRPVAICQVSEDTILAWRVSIEEAIYKMLPKTI